MSELIHLEGFRRKLMADKGFASWLKRFQEQFGPDTCLQDLTPATLLFLASPGEENMYVYFDLVMGALGLGGSVRFRLDHVDSATKLRIMDTAFALLDRVRLEVMRRLAWVEAVPGEETPIIALVKEAWSQESAFAREVPRLSHKHPDYERFVKLPELDRRVFIRRLIPQAVAAFKGRVEGA